VCPFQARPSIFRGKNAPFQLEDNITFNPESGDNFEFPDTPIPEIPIIPEV
jgi:hypothetical protein